MAMFNSYVELPEGTDITIASKMLCHFSSWFKTWKAEFFRGQFAILEDVSDGSVARPWQGQRGVHEIRGHLQGPLGSFGWEDDAKCHKNCKKSVAKNRLDMVRYATKTYN